MDDRTMLELAVKAAGIEYWVVRFAPRSSPIEKIHVTKDGETVEWNPLTDDGDALRLAVKLGLSITPYPIYNLERHSVIVKQRRASDTLREPNPTEVAEVYNGDPLSATRRAIVRAAAEVQLSKESGK